MRVIVADANVLLSAATGRAAQRVFLAVIEIYTTEHTLGEVRKYLPEFARRYHLTLEAVEQEINELPMEIMPKAYYAEKLAEAGALMRSIDPNDIDVAALALKLAAPVWSNDDDFKSFPLGRYTTAELLKFLDS